MMIQAKPHLVDLIINERVGADKLLVTRLRETLKHEFEAIEETGRSIDPRSISLRSSRVTRQHSSFDLHIILMLGDEARGQIVATRVQQALARAATEELGPNVDVRITIMFVEMLQVANQDI
jgi:hypothetical protein